MAVRTANIVAARGDFFQKIVALRSIADFFKLSLMP